VRYFTVISSRAVHDYNIIFIRSQLLRNAQQTLMNLSSSWWWQCKSRNVSEMCYYHI